MTTLPAMPVTSNFDATLNFERLRKKLPKPVTELPSSPIDEQEVYFQTTTMAESGVVWHLRYRAASASSHKWEFVGGPEWLSAVSGSMEKATLAEEALTGGPTMTVPVAGEYRLGLRLLGDSRAAALILAEGRIGVNGVGGGRLFFSGGRSEFEGVETTNREVASLAALAVLTVRVNLQQAQKFLFESAQIGVLPVRVG